MKLKEPVSGMAGERKVKRMRCPECGYSDGFNIDEMETEEGERGKFYSLPISLERKRSYEVYPQQKVLYGCPMCRRTFIED